MPSRLQFAYEPGRMGRPAYKPLPRDRQDVLDMVRVGMPIDRIAAFYGVDEKTLRKHFAGEIEHGLETAIAIVHRNLIAMSATNVTAAMFYLQNRKGDVWKDRRRVSGDKVDDRPDLSTLTEEELALLEQAALLLGGPVIEGEAVEVGGAEDDEESSEEGEEAA